MLLNTDILAIILMTLGCCGLGLIGFALIMIITIMRGNITFPMGRDNLP